MLFPIGIILTIGTMIIVVKVDGIAQITTIGTTLLAAKIVVKVIIKLVVVVVIVIVVIVTHGN
jgi:hypothetical protein